MNSPLSANISSVSAQKVVHPVAVQASPARLVRLGRRRLRDGQKLGNLLVQVAYAELRNKKWHAQCLCDCGKPTIVGVSRLIAGITKSCGHLRLEATTFHGMAGTPTYCSWHHMRQRTGNPNNDAAEYYSNRGITVCIRWEKFENFLADMGERPDGTTLERKDVNGHYEPGNCEWATRQQQVRNRRNNVMLTHDGRTLCLREWANELGMSYRTLDYRIKSGMTVNEALTRPVNKRHSHPTPA
jgi:hypothetical protein